MKIENKKIEPVISEEYNNWKSECLQGHENWLDEAENRMSDLEAMVAETTQWDQQKESKLWG